MGRPSVGKTLLTEALLFEAGAVRNKGSLGRGTTVSDYDPQERTLQHSLDAAVCTFEDGPRQVTFIDTPGLPDLVGRALSTLDAAETAAIVVSAVLGVDPVTQRTMEVAAARGLCRVIVINQIDHRDAKPAEVLAQLREVFGKQCLPLALPADGGKKVVDCFFQESGPATDFSSVATAHSDLVEQIVEMDEPLLSQYLEGREPSPDELHDAFEAALREGHLVPVCFVSAETGAGVPELLNVIRRLLPNPSEGTSPHFVTGHGGDSTGVAVAADPDKHVLARVFKVTVDPFVGKLGFLRVHQGTLRPGSQIFVGDARKPIKIAHLYHSFGKDHAEVASAGPGDICAVTKVDEVAFDAVLHDSHDEDQVHLEKPAFPSPMHGVAIEPERRGEEQRLSDSLHKLVAEDPCVRVEHHAALNETVLYGMGDLHLRVLLDRMTERYGAHVKTHPPSIPYRETITRSADGHCRHKKQTGGAGQFGEVYLRVEALERGGGFEFVDEVVGGAIPFQFIPAVEKGVRQALAEGVVAGYPIEDVRVVVYDGKHHPVDSKEVAFVSAGRKAFIDAVKKANPIVLEPVVSVEVTAPSSKMGDILGDLAAKRSRIGGNTSLANGLVAITALVPLAELNGYQSRLKSLTGGEGNYSLDLSHYAPVPQRKQQELAEAYRPHGEQD